MACSKKEIILNLFFNNVKNKKITYPSNCNKKHCGKDGYWLEKQMEIKHNCKNEPDLYGYEMKSGSKKITFGDYNASEYLFSRNKQFLENINNWDKNKNFISRLQFIEYFGTIKNNRYSWSGSCVPTYGDYNNCGQKLEFDQNLNLCIFYSFDKDIRENKHTYPDFIKKDIMIAIWKREKLEKNINNKFNINGFFICKKINNVYQKICFGEKFDYLCFVENIKNKNIIFDSGMYEGNSRNYSKFRSSSNKFWDNLIVEEYS
jgi:hypothetical protein